MASPSLSPNRLPPGQQLAAPGKWPTVGQREPLPWTPPWRVEVAGLVSKPRSWTLAELQEFPQTEASIDIHCVTRWSKLDVPLRGVMLADVLRLAQPASAARFVSFVAHSAGAHSTSLPLAEALELGAIIALEAEGRPLPESRGGPVRMVVPVRYFYKSLKWLARIELLADDRLGYWEAAAGYHNTADPWREQRYVAAGIGKRDAARLIASRDFSGRDLLGIDASGRDLAGLDARGALLRNADFRGANLRAARFEGANLSNARFRGADLREAVFFGADVEGADFSGADLRGADLRVASLLGVTFAGLDLAASQAAVVDAATVWDAASLEQLAPPQAEFVRRADAELRG
jgi:DMSO/TMAO reductase YedYZ molybdopterin-dependent catalytic subunit